MKPIFYLYSVFENFRIRQEEYEADRQAVKNGYGEYLIKTFKAISSDELINVNPDATVEFLEYNHPGMYHRIIAIKKYMDEVL